MGTVCNERIIAALLTEGTTAGAARSLGISEKTIRERRSQGAFALAYRDAQREILRGVVHELQGALLDSVRCMAEIVRDPGVNAAVRLQAAQQIVASYGRISSAVALADDEDARRENPVYDL